MSAIPLTQVNFIPVTPTSFVSLSSPNFVHVTSTSYAISSPINSAYPPILTPSNNSSHASENSSFHSPITPSSLSLVTSDIAEASTISPSSNPETNSPLSPVPPPTTLYPSS